MLLQPSQPVLPIHLEDRLEFLPLLEEDGAEDDLVVAVDGLVMVRVRGAVTTIVAVHRRSGVAMVRVLLDFVLALGELEVRLGDQMVEGEGAAGEDLAGVAVARSS